MRMHDYDTTLKEVLLGSARLTLHRLTGLDITSWRNVELPQVTAPASTCLPKPIPAS